MEQQRPADDALCEPIDHCVQQGVEIARANPAAGPDALPGRAPDYSTSPSLFSQS